MTGSSSSAKTSTRLDRQLMKPSTWLFMRTRRRVLIGEHDSSTQRPPDHRLLPSRRPPTVLQPARGLHSVCAVVHRATLQIAQPPLHGPGARNQCTTATRPCRRAVGVAERIRSHRLRAPYAPASGPLAITQTALQQGSSSHLPQRTP